MLVKVRTWGGIGDVLLTTPALRELKRRHPRARVKVYCTRRPHVEVLRHNPYVDVLKLSDGRWAEFLAGQAYAARSWAQHIAKRPPTPGGVLTSATGVLLPRYAIWAPTLTRMHASEIIAQMLEVTLRDRRLDIFLTPEEREKATAAIAAYPNPIVIHITSASSDNQNWPVDRWESLVANNPQYTFIQLGLPREARVRSAVDLRGRTSLRESFALIAAAPLFVGVVSSLAHATNATNTPAVVLFGPAPPEVWGHPNQRIVTRQLRCAPCIDTLQHHPCPYGKPCLNEITVEDVEAAIAAETQSRFARIAS